LQQQGEEDVLLLSAARGLSQADRSGLHDLPAGTGVLGAALHSPQPLVYASGEQAYTGETAAALIMQRGGYLGIPLRARGHVLGVLSVFTPLGRQVPAEEVALFAAIGEQIGVAADNARLYRQAEQLAVMEERQRLARELHDAVTQSLYSLTLLAETARRALAAEQWAQLGGYLERLGAVSQDALKEMRLLLYELRPASLAREGLVGALQRRLDAVEARAGVQTRLLLPSAEITLAPNVENALFRIAQEALNNALKHAGASAVTVNLRQEEHVLILEVEDNGNGFDPRAAESGGQGLHNMRERAVGAGGSLDINSVPGEGTKITARIPLAAEGG
jgi:signal transduction histidine kinase